MSWFPSGSCLSPLLFIIVMDAISEGKEMKIFVKQLESLVSHTRYGKQDCVSMDTCSEEKMIAVSKRS